MDDNASRAIMIGVGVFVIMLVLTGILLYINTARNMATVVDKSLNSWDDITYSNIMDYDGDITIKCTGIDFVNFLRKNIMREDIKFTLNEVSGYENLPISWWKNESTGNVSEVKLAKVDTSAQITMTKKTTEDRYGVKSHLIIVEGNIFSNRDAYVTDSFWEMQKDSSGNYAYVTDGNVVLEIGDSVSYKTSKSSGTSWKVLGAYEGKILLLGSAYQRSNLNFSELRDNEVTLADLDNTFKGWDNGTGAYSGSARCLNFEDISRLTGVTHSSSYSNYGTTYEMVWKNASQVLIDDSFSINTSTVYLYNSALRKFEKSVYAETLPDIKNNGYIGYAVSTGAGLENLTTKASDMLNKSYSVFLMNISTEVYQGKCYYTASILINNKIKENVILDIAGNASNAAGYYLRPVIALERSVKLTKSGTSWKISN